MQINLVRALVVLGTLFELHGAQQQMVVERFSKEEKQKSAEVHMQIEQETKEKLSEEAELSQAFGSCELVRFSKSEIVIAAMDTAGKVLVAGDSKGNIHCGINKQWLEFALFEQAPTLLAVSDGYIAAYSDNLLVIIEIEKCQRPQEFELTEPLLALASHQGNGSFVALDAKRELVLFALDRQSRTHQSMKVSKKIEIRGTSKVQLSALGTVLVALDEKRIYLEPFIGKNPIARTIESSKPFTVAGVSPDGSLLVTGVGTEFTAWKSCGAPCSFTLECAPKQVIIDNENRFVLCISEKENGWVCCDLQTKSIIHLPSMGGACITQTLFLPSRLQAFLTVDRSAQQETIITAHLLNAVSLLSQEQRQLLLNIVRGAHDATLQPKEQALLASLNPLINRVLASRYKVKL